MTDIKALRDLGTGLPDGYHVKLLPDVLTALLDRLEAQEQRVADLSAALRDLLDCPYYIDEATVPKAGIDAAPDQVVGNMSVALSRRRNARKALEDSNG